MSAKPVSVNPIPGIVVKVGKSSGSAMTTVKVGANGEIQFEVLEAVDFKFIIRAPESSDPNSTKKKVVEKATSGLKDTLKTNV